MNTKAIFSVLAIGILSLAHSQLGFGTYGDFVSYSTYRSGQDSNILTAGTYVIESQNQFRSYWAKSQGVPASSAPTDIDFLQYRLVAIHIGFKETRGHNVFVKSVDKTDAGTITVTYVEQSPRSTRNLEKRDSSPWTIIQVPRIAGRFVFQRETGFDRFNRFGSENVILGPFGNVTIIQPNNRHRHQGNVIVIEYAVYGSGIQCNLQRPETFIIRNHADLFSYWRRTLGSVPGRRPYDVNWDNEFLAAIHIGQRQSGGYSVKISQIVETAPGYATVYYREQAPAPGSLVTQQLTSPYIVFGIPSHIQNIKFVEEVECP